MLVLSAAFWGLFWIPLRAFESAGLGAAWAGVGQFLTPFLVMLPMAVWLAARGKPTGLGCWKTALFTGGAFALYADSLLLTEVARALILFYVSPVWSTVLEVVLMKRRLTVARVLAILMGLAGLYVILGGHGELPLPRNAGDWMALLSGMAWAYGSTRVRMAPEVTLFENVFSFFAFAALIGLVPTFIIPCAIRSLFPSPRQEGVRRRCRGIVKHPRHPEGAGKATRRAAPRGPRTSSRAACDAPASRRATLLAGNLGAPSYGTRNYESGY